MVEYYKANFNSDREKLSYNPVKIASNEGEINHHKIDQCKQMQRSKFIQIDLGDVDTAQIHPLKSFDPVEARKRFLQFAKDKHVLIDFCIPAKVNEMQ